MNCHEQVRHSDEVRCGDCFGALDRPRKLQNNPGPLTTTHERGSAASMARGLQGFSRASRRWAWVVTGGDPDEFDRDHPA